jgi:hypothetical protein
MKVTVRIDNTYSDGTVTEMETADVQPPTGDIEE